MWKRKTIKSRKYRIGWIFLAFVFSCTLLCPVCAQASSFSKKALTVKAVRKGTSVTLSWDKRSGATSYRVYKTNASGSKRTLVKTVKKTSCTLKSLSYGKTYYYQVRAVRKKNGKKQYSAYSQVVRVKVPAKKTSDSGTQKSTLKKLLQTALLPVGSTMYVWGGGWNKADTGAGKEARTIGVSTRWKQFFEKQTSSYDYRTTRYQISNGLDCSGYIGWCIYNILNTKSGNAGYVMYAEKMAKNFADRGWGTYRARSAVKDYRAGDIMSSACSDCGHVWLVVGSCSDGSVVLLHSSPPGVQLCGTPAKNGTTNSQAVKLAKKYMKKYYPAWYKKYPNCSRGSSYLSHYAQMRWDISGESVMTDPDGYRNMTAAQILKDLFDE